VPPEFRIPPESPFAKGGLREFGAVMARSEATKQSQGGGTRAHEREIAAPSPPSAWRMARNDRSREMRGSRGLKQSAMGPCVTRVASRVGGVRLGRTKPTANRLDSRFPFSRGQVPIFMRTGFAGMIRLRRTEGLVVDSPQERGVPRFTLVSLRGAKRRSNLGGVGRERMNERLPRLLHSRLGEWLAMTGWRETGGSLG